MLMNKEHTETTHTTLNRKEMGESCEEGGRCPSHKIPQDTDAKLKCSKQCFIHLPIYQITIKIQACSALQFPCYNSHFSNVDVSSL